MRRVKLKDIADLQNGKAFKPSDWTTEGLPIVRIQNLNDETKPFNYHDGKVKPKYHINSGDLLFSWSGTPGTSFGAFIWDRGPAYLNQHIYRVDIKADTDTKYFKYALNSKLEEIINQSHGGVGLKHITKKRLENIYIPLPSLDEQKAIVAKLDRAQRLIDIDRAMLAKYDELIQSVFLEMFGDPVTNPKGWEMKPFKEIAEIDKDSFDPTDFEGEVNYVGLENIEKDSGKLVEVGKIVEGDLKSNKYKFTSKHILYGKLRPYLNKVAFPYSNGVCSTDILPIKPIEDVSIKYFIGYLLKSREFVNYADKNSSGANLPRISPKMIRKFDSFLPPIELQIEFGSFVEKINCEKEKIETVSKSSQELFSSLLRQAFG